jgi:hypothetical protein
MPNSNLSREDFLEILEKSTYAQLKALRALRQQGPQPTVTPADKKGTSNIEIVYQLLRAAPGPLHVDDLIAQAQQRYGRRLSRDSLVSALTKKVLDQHTFCRTAPNTFDLLQRPPQS